MVKLPRYAVWLAAFLALPGAAAPVQDGPLLARGKYLMDSMVACANCHAAQGNTGQPLFGASLSGGLAFIDPAFQVYAANITPDIETGIGTWTDDQLKKAIREGIRPDGSVIGPPMPIPFYRHISDADLDAIVVYLRAQPAVRNEVKAGVYHIPLQPNYGPPVHDVATPSRSDRVLYGQYLATIAHCMDCHTPRNGAGMLVVDRLGAGGQVFKGPWGEHVAPNLTPDESGLKNWTDQQIEYVLRHGADMNGKHYGAPMAFDWYKNINGDDMTALIAYLRALPAQPSGAGR